MIRGLYTAAAGMVTQQRRHDTAVQNIANLNTTGYKQVDSVSHAFPDVLISAMSGGTTKPEAASTQGFLQNNLFPNICRAI